jgi:hypothetical protein
VVREQTMYLKELVKVKCPFQAHSEPNARPSLTKAYFENVYSQSSCHLDRRCELSYSSRAFEEHAYWYVKCNRFGH